MSAPSRIRLGTRRSELALWQANEVRRSLLVHHPGLEVELVEIVTEGDRILDRPLAEVGGKGLFVREIEERLLAGEIDLAVHSLKDLPAREPEGLLVACTPERADPRDVLVGPPGSTLSGLPHGTRVGTSSLRRAALLRRSRSDLEVVPVRGNVPTRLRKLDEGVCDVVVLAAAGLDRLGLEARISERLDVEAFCPAAGQGILALEIRADDPAMAETVRPLDHAETAIRAAAERAFLGRLEGGCQVPMGCHARVVGEVLQVHGIVADPSGRPYFAARREGSVAAAAELGVAVAEGLLELGAGRVIGR